MKINIEQGLNLVAGYLSGSQLRQDDPDYKNKLDDMYCRAYNMIHTYSIIPSCNPELFKFYGLVLIALEEKTIPPQILANKLIDVLGLNLDDFEVDMYFCPPKKEFNSLNKLSIKHVLNMAYGYLIGLNLDDDPINSKKMFNYTYIVDMLEKVDISSINSPEQSEVYGRLLRKLKTYESSPQEIALFIKVHLRIIF